MNLELANEIVTQVIKKSANVETEILPETPLIGRDAVLDSMKIVEVCLSLEDLAEENGFEFDWTSEAAMSKSKGMFRSVSALAEEFSLQSEA